MEEETIEDYCFKCPYCGKFGEPSDFQKDMYEELIDCGYCEKKFVGTAYTSTQYTATSLEKYVKDNKAS